MPDEQRGDRWASVRSERLEQQQSRIRRWFSHRLDRIEDRLPEPIVEVIERLRNRETLLFAAGLAYYSLISVVPALLIVAWISGSLLGEDRVESLAERLDELAPGEVDIQSFVQNLLQVGTGVGLAALVVALWPATAFGGGLVRALDAMSVDENPAMHGLRGRARALAVLIVLPVVVLGGFAAATLSTAVLGDGVFLTVAGWILAIVAGTLVSWLAVMALHWWFGPAELDARARATGAALSAVGLAVMSLGYTVYLSEGADWEERVAGSGLAAAVLLALWLYLANLLLLAGYALSLAIDSEEHGFEPSE